MNGGCVWLVKPLLAMAWVGLVWLSMVRIGMALYEDGLISCVWLDRMSMV